MKFSDIQSRDELANFLGIKTSSLTYVLYKKSPNAFYVSFEIPKKMGGVREIHAPTGQLKAIQRQLANKLWEHQENLRNEKGLHVNISHAFEKTKSIKTNAQIHRNKYVVLNLDLENFFESIHFGRVVGYFEKNRDFCLPHSIAIMIAQLTCFNGCLPQGAPSSPIITNLICQILDWRILRIAKQNRLDYTRYADDLTFSTNDRSFVDHKDAFLSQIEAEVHSAGFKINHHKTRISLRISRQTVTGLTVNQKINVSSTYSRETRAMAHRLYKSGAFDINGEEGTIAQLEGRFSFIDQLDRYNNKIDGKTHDCWTLNSREKQYKAFLFFKHFYVNAKPLIVTEGKTDVRYLKAALMKLHNEYPNLITRDSHNHFSYQISFLRKSKHLKYFLNISSDGADALRNIYNYYIGTDKGFPNYYERFSSLRAARPENPVVLLFDNEMVSKDKPLYRFLQKAKVDEKGKTCFEKNRYLQLINDGNLYLATNPLADGKPECAIESLFNQETLGHVIGGKSFSLDNNYDRTKYYGKEEFSQYVSKNYSQIDFSGFRGLLDTLSRIVQAYSESKKI